MKNRTYAFYQMVRADFLERTRRYSFLLTLAAALYLGYAVAAEKVWVVIGAGYRGVYNSAWIGALMAVCCSTFFSLVGFYVVKNSVQRDTDTRVGQILAATPMRKTFYTAAKAASNFAVLTAMVAVLMLAALVMQWLHAEIHEISLWKLWSPFLLLTLPVMALTAAIAVLFETTPGLRGGLGNVVYFFVWSAGLAVGVQSGMSDPMGIQLLFASTRTALLQLDPHSPDAFYLTVGGARAVRTFLWSGFNWTPAIVLHRLVWVGVAAALASLASVFFHRFDPAYERSGKKVRPSPASLASGESDAPLMRPRMTEPVRLTPLTSAGGRSYLLQLVSAELKLMLKGQRWWWYAGAAGLLIGGLASTTVEARKGCLLVAWIWPVLLWSQMGARESRYATASLIFCSEHSLRRQLPAVWIAGVAVAVLTGAGVGIRCVLSGDWPGLAAWLAGALFIPSLALALGVWSGSGKAFEALYTVWWYIGPLHHTPGLDFIGTSTASSTPAAYVLAAAALVGISYLGRRMRLGYA